MISEKKFNEYSERVLVCDIEGIEYLRSYRCAGFEMQDVINKANDLAIFNKNVMSYAIEDLKKKFQEGELLYIVMACFNSVIMYDMEPVEFLCFQIMETNKYEIEYNGNINEILNKIKKLSPHEALLLYYLAKQVDNKTNQPILI